MKKQFIITVDLGGTKILAALLNTKNKILFREKVGTDISKGARPIVSSIAECVNKLLKQAKLNQNKIGAIALGVPGTVNPKTGIIGSAPNLQIRNFNIKKEMKKYFRIPVLIENDVNLAALGIKRFEFKNKLNNSLVVFVGTGIGSALIFDGKLYRGSSFYAGEIGHMKVDASGAIGANPQNKTFETIASRTAIVNGILAEIKKGKRSKLAKVYSNKRKIKSKSLASAVASKDKLALKYVDNSCKVIGTVLGSLTTLLNIDTIVLGGGVLEAMGRYMLPKIKKSFKEAVLKEPGSMSKIVGTKLGDDAPLYGGIELANEYLN